MANPIRLSEILTDIARLYATLKVRRNARSARDLRDRIIDLRNTLDNDILKSLNILDSNKVEQWDAMDDVWKMARLKALEEKVALEESVELSDFFFNVSNAVIKAQTTLNQFSKNYVENLQDPRVPQTYFAIPSVKAEMKIGFSELSEKGVNVILFKNTEQRNRYAESTITFELVSAPPLAVPPPPLTPPPKLASQTQLSASHKPRATGVPTSLSMHPHPPRVSMQLLEMPALRDLLLADSSGSPSPDTLVDAAGDEPREDEARERDESEAEDIPALRRSLEEARTTFFAATDRLIESRAIFESRAKRALRQETPVIAGVERDSVLDSIASELEASGEKLGENFAEGREQALVLKYRSTGKEEADRFFVLWPGISGNKAEEGRELRVYDLAVREGVLKLHGSAFGSAPENSFLSVVPKKQLLRLKKNEMADLASALGDALMIVSTILNEWLEASRHD